MEVAFTVTDEVQAAIARIGRTEDVRLSPDQRRLALVGHHCNRLLILDLDLGGAAQGIKLTGWLEIESDSFDLPHGVAWLDRRTLVVANRASDVVIFELPARSPASGSIKLAPLRTIGREGADVVTTPGSVSVAPIGLGLVELLVCNNYVHHVSRHLLDQNDGFAPVTSEVLLHDGLEVPDGVAHSGSGRWLAVSNHEQRSIFLYRNDVELNPESAPLGRLRGAKYPHGLHFAADDRWLAVADAGTPFVYIYKSDDGDWAGEREPFASLQVVSDDAFERGHFNPQEGGPKGVHFTPDGGLMVITCHEVPLAFFDMRSLISPCPSGPGGRGDVSEVERARETLIRYLAADRARLRTATDATRRAYQREMETVLNSRAWKLIAPLRWVMAKQRAVRGRWRDSGA